ncbi:MAG: flagellar biosynthesis protein [Thermotogota bacterium]|nr:flagellar biosynthesis protein [Thermotogota bacterium]MDK2864007.1 flagellar biosynthesis protein [Thermotogota bacterium]HCZ06530.1 flagellar biosynthesis protein FlhB [Thermotogota bacterium]
MSTRERKLKKAAALRYDPESDLAPRVVASGVNEIAERIVEIAKDQGIPVVENPDLVEKLVRLEIYSEIPPELYQVVAEVLAFVYRLGEYGQ